VGQNLDPRIADDQREEKGLRLAWPGAVISNKRCIVDRFN